MFGYDILNQDTNLVTLSIGGNDFAEGGFGAMIQQCVEGDCSDVTITDQQLAFVASKLAPLYQAIRQKAPNARRIVILYPQIFPVTVTSTCPYGIEQDEATAIRNAWARINGMIWTVAEANQWEVLQSGNAFSGNSICDSTPYANGLVLKDVVPPAPSRESYHPNKAGHNRLFNLLTQFGV